MHLRAREQQAAWVSMDLVELAGAREAAILGFVGIFVLSIESAV
jgi:hypothetical protein